MNAGSNVRPIESSFILTHAFRMCKKKVVKKSYTNDKVTPEEKDLFRTCIAKYISITEQSYEGMREGFLETL